MDVEGTLEIALIEKETSTSPAIYGVAFLPYQGQGGAYARIKFAEGNLVAMFKEMHIGPDRMQEILKDVKEKGEVFIENVFSPEDLINRYGLGHVGTGKAILSYLSALTSNTSSTSSR